MSLLNPSGLLARIREEAEKWENEAIKAPHLGALCIGMAQPWRKLESDIEAELLAEQEGMLKAENEAKEDKNKMMNECYSCLHRRSVPGNCHIMCAKPDADMTGNQHGIKKGWFMYPLLFDPTWKTKLCSNFEPIPAVSVSVSGAVSDET